MECDLFNQDQKGDNLFSCDGCVKRIELERMDIESVLSVRLKLILKCPSLSTFVLTEAYRSNVTKVLVALKRATTLKRIEFNQIGSKVPYTPKELLDLMPKYDPAKALRYIKFENHIYELKERNKN